MKRRTFIQSITLSITALLLPQKKVEATDGGFFNKSVVQIIPEEAGELVWYSNGHINNINFQ